MPFCRRRQTLRSLGLSRLLFSSPSWGALSLSEQEAWRKSWTKIARLLFPDDRWSQHPALPGTPEVCAAAHLPGPVEALRAERLQHFVRLVNAAQETLFALLLHELRVSSAAWLGELRNDLSWAVYWGGLPGSVLDDFPDGFVQFALDSPSRAKRLISKAARLAPVQMTAHNTARNDDPCACPHCSETFGSLQRLKVHLFAVHGLRAEADGLAQGVTCPCCLRRYWSRSRLTRHLQYDSRPCRDALNMHGMHLPAPTQAMRRAWTADAASFQHLPTVRVAGPLLCLASRMPADVVAEALDTVASAADPDDALCRLTVFRSTFFLSPFLQDTLEGISDAYGLDTAWLLA